MRLHDRVVEAVRKGDDLVCPMPGQFRAAVATGDVCRAGMTLGELDVLGRVAHVAAHSADARGVIARVADGAIEYGGALVALDPNAALLGQPAMAAAAENKHAGEPAGRVFRAPTSGRVYTAPGRTDKPAFVVAGAALQASATICLLEVMKTFHRVTYAGEPARVAAVLANDGADVDAGDPLLALE